MNTRAFQIVDLVKTPFLGEIYVDIYNTEEDVRKAGYSPTGNSDQYGYMIWKFTDLIKPYWKQQYAIVVKI